MYVNNRWLKIILRKLSFFSFRIPLEMIYGFITKKKYKIFGDKEIIITTTNAIGLTISLSKTLGLIKSPVVFIAMGLIPRNCSFLIRLFYKLILQKINLVTISKSEEKFLKKVLSKQDITYLPFGIDNSFWHPVDEVNHEEEYVLAIGNDNARDWDTLINSWESSFPDLKLVTSKKLKFTKENIHLIQGSWTKNTFSDSLIRKYYNNAKLVIIPLIETIQPSGQSVCLQAMSCKKPVIMTNTIGLWDKEKLIHKENIYLVSPNSLLN